MSGRLSVWPPESASTVMSSATGTCGASRASSSVILPCARSAASISRRRRRHELTRHLGRETFANTCVTPLDPARRVETQAVQRVVHHVRRQRHVGGRRHPRHAAPQVELDDGGFEIGFVGRVDQVGSDCVGSDRALDLVDRAVDTRRAQAGGAEESQHSRARRGDDHRGGRDAVGHLPDDVREADVVGDAEIAARRATRGRSPEGSPTETRRSAGPAQMCTKRRPRRGPARATAAVEFRWSSPAAR